MKCFLATSQREIENFSKIRFLIKISPEPHRLRKTRLRSKGSKILLQVSTQAIRLLLSISCIYSKVLAGLKRRQPVLFITLLNSDIIGKICLLLLKLLQVKCLESVGRSLRSIYIWWRKVGMFRKQFIACYKTKHESPSGCANFSLFASNRAWTDWLRLAFLILK